MPLVSVIIPTYNHSKFIPETLDSVFRQTFSDFEVLVINDGSKDDTHTVLARLAHHESLRYIEQPNMGQGAARNRGLKESSGVFIAFLDDDDLWPVDKLAWQVEYLQNAPRAIAVAGEVQAFGRSSACWRFRQDQCVAQFGEIASRGLVLFPGQALIRATRLRELGGLDADVPGADDWDLWLRLTRSGEVHLVKRTALFYRRHEANATYMLARMERSQKKVIQKNFGSIPKLNQLALWRRVRRNVQVFNWGNALDVGLLEFRRGHRLHALFAVARAFRWRPIGSAVFFVRRWGGRCRQRIVSFLSSADKD
jgi:glycosyltransferase involved in cell wall biosynthesis